MLFEKFIEQHRVHRFIADGVGLSLLVAGYQVGIYLFHVLGHEAKLRNPIGVKLFLVPKRHWFQRQDRFARFVHWLNRFLETRRGDNGAEFTGAPNDDSYPARHGCPRNARDEGARLRSALADADGLRFTSDTVITDIDIIAPRSERRSSRNADGDVIAASGIGIQSIVTQ